MPVAADTGTPAPAPSSTILPPPLLTVQGSLVYVLVAACDQLPKWKHISCASDYIRQSKVFIFDGGNHYDVIFDHGPGLDDGVGVSVPK
jgi:hypothetical protein